MYGEPQIRKYTDNNGVERQAFDIQAFDVEFLSTKQETEGNGEQRSQQQHSAPQSYIGGGKGNGGNRPQRKPVQMEVFEDDGDIPF